MKLTYWLDHTNRIVKVGGDWDQFALANDGEEACAEMVMGMRLRDFVSGDTTRMWITTVLDLTRVTRRTQHREYRCDSPSVRRFMGMTLCPESKDIVRLDHEVLREEAMETPVHFLQPSRGISWDDKGYVKRCSICNRMRTGDEWHEPDSDSATHDNPVRVIHGVCDDCKKAFHRSARAV